MTNTKENNKFLEVFIPCIVFIASLLVWEATVSIKNIPVYILPAPSAIFAKLVEDRALLLNSLSLFLSLALLSLYLQCTVCTLLSIL